MEFGILGPLEVRHDGRERPIAGAKQRALLAVLLLNVNHVVSSDRLVAELWGSEPPESGHAALRVRVSQLRKAIEPGYPDGGLRVLRTQAPGYILAAEPGTCTSKRAEEALAPKTAWNPVAPSRPMVAISMMLPSG